MKNRKLYEAKSEQMVKNANALDLTNVDIRALLVREDVLKSIVGDAFAMFDLLYAIREHSFSYRSEKGPILAEKAKYIQWLPFYSMSHDYRAGFMSVTLTMRESFGKDHFLTDHWIVSLTFSSPDDSGFSIRSPDINNFEKAKRTYSALDKIFESLENVPSQDEASGYADVTGCYLDIW